MSLNNKIKKILEGYGKRSKVQGVLGRSDQAQPDEQLYQEGEPDLMYADDESLGGWEEIDPQDYQRTKKQGRYPCPKDRSPDDPACKAPRKSAIGLESEQIDELNNDDQGKAVPRGGHYDYSAAEREYWQQRDWDEFMKQVEFVLTHQEEIPELVRKYSREHLESMHSSQLETIYNDIKKRLGIKEDTVKEHHLHTRKDKINFILKHEKDLLSADHWFRHVGNFSDIPDSEVDRLYRNMEQMLELTGNPVENAIVEFLDEVNEQHIRNRDEKIKFILDKQEEVHDDPRKWFNQEDLALFNNKYIDKLYSQIQFALSNKLQLTERKGVNWAEINKAMSNKQYDKVSHIFDVTTQIGADEVMTTLLKRGYTNKEVFEVIRAMFGNDIPKYFIDKLDVRQLAQQAQDDVHMNDVEETTTTASMAAPDMPAFGDKPDHVKREHGTWAGLNESSMTTMAVGVPDVNPTTRGAKMSGSIEDESKKEKAAKKRGEVLDSLGYTAVTSEEAFGDPEPPKDDTPPRPTSPFDESKTLDDKINTLLGEGHPMASPPGHPMGATLGQLDLTPDPVPTTDNYLDIYKMNEDEEDEENENENIFKGKDTKTTQMKNERYPVQKEDVKLLESAAKPLGYKVLAVRGDLKESGSEDKLEIAVEKGATKALVEYNDKAIQPFMVGERPFTTFQTALGFISENAYRFTTQEVEKQYNEKATKRSLEEQKELENYTKDRLENYAKERKRFEGREEELIRKTMSETEMKRGVYFRD